MLVKNACDAMSETVHKELEIVLNLIQIAIILKSK